MNIAAYCRVSTDKLDQLNSLETQKDFFVEYAKKEGHNLVNIYADEGISGTKTKNRKEFQRLMRDAERGIFEAVVIKDISRLARNTVDLLQSIRRLKELGIDAQFLNANMTSMGDSEFFLTIFAAIAQEESANMSKRVKFGKKENAKKGRVPNIVYGYNKKDGDYFNLSVNQEEAGIVRQIFDWYTKGGYGTAKIANMLNERGLKTKRKCSWSQHAVSRILTNEIYTGKIINGKEEVADFLTGRRVKKEESKWIVTERPELQIIETKQFEQAQQILHSRYDAFCMTRERQSNRHLFSTLIKCKECGWSFRRSVRTYKNTYIRWVCSGHNGRGADSCPNAVTVDEEELIRELEVYFEKILREKRNIIQHLVKEFKKIYKAREDNAEYVKELNARIERLKKARQKYMDMYTDDVISREEMQEKTAGMRKELERLNSERKLAENNMNKGDRLEELIQGTFSKIEDVVSVRDMTNEQLKQIVQRIEVDKDGNVDIILRIIGDLGLEESVLINDNNTQGCSRAPGSYQSGSCKAGQNCVGY